MVYRQAPRNLREFEIWAEGFQATGQSGGATLMGKGVGVDFRSACHDLARENREFSKYFNSKTLSYWGCKLFSTEAAARKNFG